MIDKQMNSLIYFVTYIPIWFQIHVFILIIKTIRLITLTTKLMRCFYKYYKSKDTLLTILKLCFYKVANLGKHTLFSEININK